MGERVFLSGKQVLDRPHYFCTDRADVPTLSVTTTEYV